MIQAKEVTESINVSLREALVDPTMPFAVLIRGGPLSVPVSGTYQYKGYKKIMRTFSTESEAKDYAKRMNDSLSKGEKSYYKTKFLVVKASPKDYVMK